MVGDMGTQESIVDPKVFQGTRDRVLRVYHRDVRRSPVRDYSVLTVLLIDYTVDTVLVKPQGVGGTGPTVLPVGLLS